MRNRLKQLVRKCTKWAWNDELSQLESFRLINIKQQGEIDRAVEHLRRGLDRNYDVTDTLYALCVLTTNGLYYARRRLKELGE